MGLHLKDCQEEHNPFSSTPITTREATHHYPVSQSCRSGFLVTIVLAQIGLILVLELGCISSTILVYPAYIINHIYAKL
jgi:hypothetical protein